MSKLRKRSTVSVLLVVLITTVLVLVSGYSSAQTREVATFVIQVAKLTPADVTGYFGFSVSISGSTLVVGSYGDDDIARDAGAAYIFERDEGGSNAWGLVTKLTASDAEEYDRFGESVSLSGDTLVVGVRGDDPYGSARVFKRDAGGPSNWGQVAKLTASDGTDASWFGYSASISGDTIVVGDYSDSELGNQSGAAYLFEKPDTVWADMTETAKLTASDAGDNHQLGGSVSIDGDTVVVGALEPDWRGSAYVFERPGTGWTDMTETAKLTASDGAEADRFETVSVSGDTIVVGAMGDDDSGSGSGAVYAFEKPATGWTDMNETAKITTSDGTDGDMFGASVALYEDDLLAGAYGNDDNGDMAGSAYLFGRDEADPNNWVQEGKILASDGAWQDEFGKSVSIDADNLLVGAWKKDSNKGATYLFREFEPVAWIYLPVVLRNAP